MTVMESQALTDLLARAGASDQDRAAWLTERAQGITATEIRDLVRGKLRQDDLIALKLGRKVDSFTGNQFTDWGNEREAIIAAGLRGMGIEPESRVFHGERNSRHLASPDGIGVEFDGAVVVSEIKTSGKDIRRGTPAYEQTGYELQMQYAMGVTGADRCLFVFEGRITFQGAFVPGQLYSEWVPRDEAIITELMARADEFLAELDRQREDGAPVIDEELDTHAVNYLRGLAAEKEGKELKESAYAAIVAAGSRRSHRSPASPTRRRRRVRCSRSRRSTTTPRVLRGWSCSRRCRRLSVRGMTTCAPSSRRSPSEARGVPHRRASRQGREPDHEHGTGQGRRIREGITRRTARVRLRDRTGGGSAPAVAVVEAAA